MWPIGFDDVAFQEAIDWFLGRTVVTRPEWDAMAEAARKKAFMVSGVAQLDVISDVWTALDRAIRDGRTFADFKADIGAKLEAAWAGTVKDPPTRLETIFRTNVQLAYSAGRYQQLTQPDTLSDRPIWKYSAILDSRVTPVCKICNGTILPADHAFWQTHIPPLHFNCRSAIIALTEDQAHEQGGIAHAAPAADAQGGFGAPPGKDDWAPDPADYPLQLWKLYTEKDLPPRIDLPKPVTPAENILHKKVGDAQGSNEGGFYIGQDGIKRYVKFYSDAAQAHGEHLANQVYRDLGFPSPQSAVFEHEGRTAYASGVVEGAKTLAAAGVTPARAKKVMAGFVADVLTANWDAVGMSKDNILVLPGGALMRVDNGGSFLMRAKAGRKSLDALPGITEWDKLRSRSVNPAYNEVASAAGMLDDQKLKPLAVKGIKAVAALRKSVGSWEAYVEKTIPEMRPADKAAVISMLESRTKLLEEKLKILTARRRRVRAPSGQVLFDMSTDLGERVRAKVKELTATDRRDEFYAALFEKAGVSRKDFDATRADVSSWTGGFRLSPPQTRLYGSFAATLGNPSEHTADPETVARLERVGPTRARRWELFLESMGETPIAPTHIRAYRGVKGIDWVLDVAKAWADPSIDQMTARSHELASWSMDPKCSQKFVEDDSNANVVHRWDVPLDESTHDQVTDDSSFIGSWFREHEIIAGRGHDRGVDLPKQDAVVTYEGTRYTYADREALLERLRRRGKL